MKRGAEMKIKSKKVISLIAVLILVVTAFTSCAGGGGGESSGGDVLERIKSERSHEIYRYG